MRPLRTLTLVLAIAVTGIVPAAAQTTAPSVCDADVQPLEEGQQYQTTTLYLTLATAGSADVNEVQGQGGNTMTPNRPQGAVAARNTIVNPSDNGEGNSLSAYWRHTVAAPTDIVCWGATWTHTSRMEPVLVDLYTDAVRGDQDRVARQTVVPTGARETLTTRPQSLQATASRTLTLQLTTPFGVVDFDSADAPSALTLVTIVDAPPTPDVTVFNVGYSPQTLTVAAGDTVDWGWTGGTHSVTADDCVVGACAFDSGVLSTTPDLGTRFVHTFTEPGTYDYYCRIHSSADGTRQNGVIIVE